MKVLLKNSQIIDGEHILYSLKDAELVDIKGNKLTILETKNIINDCKTKDGLLELATILGYGSSFGSSLLKRLNTLKDKLYDLYLQRYESKYSQKFTVPTR